MSLRTFGCSLVASVPSFCSRMLFIPVANESYLDEAGATTIWRDIQHWPNAKMTAFNFATHRRWRRCATARPSSCGKVTKLLLGWNILYFIRLFFIL